MTYEELLKRAVEVRARYDVLNAKRRRAWTGSDVMAGFVGDVGELSQIIMAKEGLRDMDDIDAKLAHELADCLWSVLVLADKYGIDLPTEFQKTMAVIDKRLDAQL